MANSSTFLKVNVLSLLELYYFLINLFYHFELSARCRLMLKFLFAR